ncbi:MAG TPA: DUF6508 domain-containing protein [Anaerolineales bacterium]|nr:DUF6508 domain-containing protein [Anaerolineales bacterium]
MKPTRLPALQEIEALTAFLPRLYAAGFSPIVTWEGGGKNKDGSYSLPYPKYDPLVEEFFGHVSSDGWLDYEYNPEQAYQMLKDEQVVKAASLPQIKSMLTFCVRGERFSDGHWGAMIEKGYVRRLLERLNEIKSEQANGL